MEADSTDSMDSEAQVAPAKKRGRGLLFWVLMVSLVAGAGAGAAWYAGVIPGLAEADAEPRERPPAPPQYFTLDSNLVVNFQGGGRMRYLQLGVQLMTRDARAIDALATHSPVIKHRLIMLLSDKSYDELVTAQGKAELQAETLAMVRQTLTELHGEPVVEDVFFTSFMMQ
jgi:flagellar protein FliL